MADNAQLYLMHESKSKIEAGISVSQRIVEDVHTPEEERLPHAQSGKLSFFTGWRKGVATGACMVTFTLLINIIVIIAFVTKFGMENGLLVLYEGQCKHVSSINLGVHLVINVLGTLLLASSNYCMQVLSAPTRQEVDRAHAQKRWLDVGLSSFRNLFRIGRWRVCLWVVLLVSSLPLHLVYNSVVFASQGAYTYTGVLANPAFLNGPVYDGDIKTWISNEVLHNPATLADVQRVQADAASFEKLSNSDCIDAYHKALLTDRSDLIVVTSFHNASDDESQVYLTFRDGDFYIDFDGIAPWICETYNETDFDRCLNQGGTPEPGTWTLKDHPIDYCLSRQTPELCKVKSSLYLMVVVIVCNVAKLAVMLIVLVKLKDDPLVTVGDAISSFMNRPDQTSADACLISKSDVSGGKFWTETEHSRLWKRRRVFRFRAVSGARWWMSFFVCLFGIAVIILFLDRAIIGLQQSGVVSSSSRPSLPQIWSFGFGVGEGTSFMTNAPPSLYSNIMLANTPQLVFSILYFVYNGLYTVMSLAAEWASFSRSRKALRVSKPVGAQRSTYYLHLPYMYAVPLILASTLMHWFISQSFYLLSVDFTGSSTSQNLTFSTCGYSTIAIIFSLGLASLMLIFIFINGFRRLTFDIPPVGSCSVAISAACHPLTEGSDSTVPLQWGVVDGQYHHQQSDSGLGHCSFSSATVLPPIEGERYGSLSQELRRRTGKLK